MTSETLANLAAAMQGSQLNTLATYLLGNVPGLPPLVQTVHLLGISAVMGSAVLVDLRAFGLALTSQPMAELTRRLMPWTWWALPALALSGLLFVVARPVRYASNPVFLLKFTMLVPALVLALAFQRVVGGDEQRWEQEPGRRVLGKLMAGLSLVCWIGVVLAGRWIAYADYLFGE